MPQPQELVRSFIQDYYDWSVRSSEATQGDNWKNVEIIEIVEKDYFNSILAKYCASEFKGQKIAFSSEPSHHPESEIVISEKVSAFSASVITKHTSKSGFCSDYEYQFSLSDNRWLLQEVFYLSFGEKYECL